MNRAHCGAGFQPAFQMPAESLHHKMFRQRRGAILIAAMWIMIILVALVLVLARSMRVEAISTGNRQSLLEADAVERGAEQYVLWQVDGAKGDALSVTSIDTEAMPVGNGYFWIISPDPTSDQNYNFGITDEASKLNLNTATSLMLQNLPAMTSDVADAIVDWADADDTPGQNGAESDYYQNLQFPYVAKNLPLESVEELLLVKGMNKGLLFGYDLNRNGFLEADESQSGGLASAVNSGSSDSRGLFNYVTAWSVEPNTTIDGQPRTSVNGTNTAPLQKALSTVLPAARVTEILAKLAPLYNPPAATGGKGKTKKPVAPAVATFTNMGVFYLASGMTPAEFGKVADLLTASTAKTLTGLVNVNTAPAQVFACLPGLDQNDANTLVSARQSADTTSIAWVLTALQPQTKALAVAGMLSTRSYIYSADIVGVSGDGRSFKRVRVVVNAQASPAKIIYRRDLTSLGWPLDPRIHDDLRGGHFAPPVQGTNSGSGGSGFH